MGNAIRKRPPVVIVLGLDDSGKTSVLYSLQKKNIDTVQPTEHSPLENIKIKQYKMMAWDLSGKDKVRNLWRHYFVGSDAVLFVIDSSNRDRLIESKQELAKLLNEPLLKDVVFMIFLNKCDLPNAMTQQEIEDQLQIESILPPPQNASDVNRRIKIVTTSAVSTNQYNLNIQDSFIWIIEQVKDRKKNLKKQLNRQQSVQ
ncbi:ADP-ribosylation factor-related [Dictyostelium discoideum AX4]|uniref:ADP-ribosylation factor-related n=1 Tax=Dictyostelium discoideum TaxID=44689 RepID=Q55AR1_DICDI|nr:ADP-ribosylation factor-related [Dictyostelium discoideum AX4]EAL71586.1 ADP-ribosylation factor-related [Dictyostelium discoideum AX4]|eukprot:XP_645461.1 ADP-ribosylation factor-related [Dictyostelium discoideum AX4]